MALEAGKVPSKMIIFLFSAGGLCPPRPPTLLGTPPGLCPGPAGGLGRPPDPSPR